MAEKNFLSFVETILKEKGSDLHIAEGRKPIIRVSGDLFVLDRYDVLSKQDMKDIMHGLMSEALIERFNQNLEVDFSYAPKEGVRFRTNTYIQQGKICMALRLIPKDIKTLEELGLPGILYEFTDMKQGFFLVVGPTGHGKSTTLASLINHINKERAEHIITIEDPVEYVFTPDKSVIDQREIRMDATDFPSALKAMFRQDGDVLMIGEMRESETISTAVTAAETGHLVYSTLHTNSASQTIERIIDSFSSGQQDQIRVQLASSLVGVFSQRLLPKISGGLVPAYELLRVTTAVSNLIREKRTHEIDTVIETSSSEGMITFNKCLSNMVREGEITIETAFLNSSDRRSLERLL